MLVLDAVRTSGGSAAKGISCAEAETSDEFAGTDVRQPVGHPISGPRDLVATPWLFDGKRPPIRNPAPLLGGDTDDVLGRVLGYSEEQIATVHDAGVVDEA